MHHLTRSDRRPSALRALRALAVLAAGGLALGAAACSDDSGSGSATTTATASDAAASGSATTAASDAAASGADATVTDIARLPDDIAAAYEAAGGETGDLGAFTGFVTDGDRTLATFATGWITSSPETGAQPLIGKIGETWFSGGALTNPVGLPTAPEAGDAVSGWDQEFQHGTVGWHQDGTGTWAATGGSTGE